LKKKNLSVVLITYNNVDQFIKSHESLSEIYDLIEEIIVVDSSTNKAVSKFIDTIEKKSKIIYFFEYPQGIYHAMNTSLRFANKNNVIWYLNPGDILINPKGILRLFRKLINSDSVWAFGLARKVINSKEEIFPREVNTLLPEHIAMGRISISHQAMFCEVNSMLELGGFDEKYQITADLKLQTLLAAKSHPVWLMEPIVEIDSNGVSHKKIFRTLFETTKVRWSTSKVSKLSIIYKFFSYLVLKIWKKIRVGS
jgi:glycosyltransferase involved in cell wall biosynthesis